MAVLGASGFVGGATCAALESHGWTVVRVSAPRFHGEIHVSELRCLFNSTLHRDTIDELAQQFAGSTVVINAAGNPDASERDTQCLLGANTLLPLLAYTAAIQAGVNRFIHVSSSVVQGDSGELNSSLDLRPFSPYSSSKALAEVELSSIGQPETQLIVYRPPSVHAEDRRITRAIHRLGSRRLLLVAGSGEQPTPQALIENVAEALAFVAESESVPAVVHHPWEGLTTYSFLENLTGRKPRRIPHLLADVLAHIARLSERIAPSGSAHRRRLELLMFGQRVAPSWFDEAGWNPPFTVERWRALGATLR